MRSQIKTKRTGFSCCTGILKFPAVTSCAPQTSYSRRFEDTVSFIFVEGSVMAALMFVLISSVCIVYVFAVQSPVLKLEYGLDIVMGMLLAGELVYGILSFMPCLKKQDYI